MENQELVKRAMADIEYLRSALDESVSTPEKRKTLKLELAVNALAFISALGLWILNLIEPQILEKAFWGSSLDRELAVMIIAIIFSFLVFGSILLYAIIWKSAKASQLRFGDFIHRNFHYLVAQSFLSDLTIKFAILALVIFSKNSDLVAPLLCLFTLDYIWQGRLFHFAKSIRIGVGMIALLMGGFLYGNSSLTISHALLFFIFASFISGISLFRSIAKAR